MENGLCCMSTTLKKRKLLVHKLTASFLPKVGWTEGSIDKIKHLLSSPESVVRVTVQGQVVQQRPLYAVPVPYSLGDAGILPPGPSIIPFEVDESLQIDGPTLEGVAIYIILTGTTDDGRTLDIIKQLC